MKMQTQSQFQSMAMTMDVVANAKTVDLDSCPIYPGVF